MPDLIDNKAGYETKAAANFLTVWSGKTVLAFVRLAEDRSAYQPIVYIASIL